ncbi:hypothetical protein [Prochlorothrix hollandica]|uniref:hypothetical protein n=1 Tax=Prochlorothrix hollandica TaxID=1223 RepID=UPI003340379E
MSSPVMPPADRPNSGDTLDHLLSLDGDLARQEKALRLKLETLHAQRESLRVVIQLLRSSPPPQPPEPDADGDDFDGADFDPGDFDANALDSGALDSGALDSGATSPGETSPGEISPDDTLVRSLNPKSAGSLGTASSSPSHAPPSWHRYLKPAYGSLSLADTIAVVLGKDPDRAWAIADITDTIFEGLSLESSMKAHDRIAHVLADGVRRQRWYRTQPGCYCLQNPQP